MKTVIILGATGSLGTQALEVLEKYPKEFKVIGLAAGKNEQLLKEQAKKFEVEKENMVLTRIGVCKTPEKEDGGSKGRCASQRFCDCGKIFPGKKIAKNEKRLCSLSPPIADKAASALLRLATLPEADIIVNVISGIAGITPTIAALKAGKTVLLGNKESIIAEGEKIMGLTKNNEKTEAAPTRATTLFPALIPLDSEHNAIFEILKKHPGRKIKRIILPASGGPLWQKSAEEIAQTTPEQALAHPKWNMGEKISIESATLINKGLEIIEAHYLFDLPLGKIETVIHPECMVHGMVEFEEETIAYLSAPDMREHIENALLHTTGQQSSHYFGTSPREIRPLKPNEFTFHEPPHEKLPGIKMVMDAFRKSREKQSGTQPAPQNSMRNFLKKEEEAITDFLLGKIKFRQIFD